MTPRANPDPDIPELYKNGRNWRLIQLVVASVILLIIIGFLIWYFFFSTSTNNKTTKVNLPATSQGAGSGSANQVNPGSSGSSSANTGSPSTNGVGSTRPSGSQPTLTNTGPGDVLAVFAGAVAISTLAYRLRCKRIVRQ